MIQQRAYIQVDVVAHFARWPGNEGRRTCCWKVEWGSDDDWGGGRIRGRRVRLVQPTNADGEGDDAKWPDWSRPSFPPSKVAAAAASSAACAVCLSCVCVCYVQRQSGNPPPPHSKVEPKLLSNRTGLFCSTLFLLLLFLVHSIVGRSSSFLTRHKTPSLDVYLDCESVLVSQCSHPITVSVFSQTANCAIHFFLSDNEPSGVAVGGNDRQSNGCRPFDPAHVATGGRPGQTIQFQHFQPAGQRGRQDGRR